jgi:hypothetical protein
MAASAKTALCLSGSAVEATSIALIAKTALSHWSDTPDLPIGKVEMEFVSRVGCSLTSARGCKCTYQAWKSFAVVVELWRGRVYSDGHRRVVGPTRLNLGISGFDLGYLCFAYSC